MATFGISMCKDEEDVIAGAVLHMADEVDEIIIADNGSIDDTRAILAELADTLPVTVLDDPDPAHYQGRKMSALAALAAERGATWVVPFDADEIWVAEDRISTILDKLRGNVATARLFNHYRTAVDIESGDPFTSMVWRQPDPLGLPKVAFRWEPGATIHEGNHAVTLPHGERPELCLEVRHFPYRSVEQFVRKARNGAAALAATDLPDDVGAHWRSYGALADRYGPEILAEVFTEHFWHLSPADSGLICDPAPYRRWQT